ncbi:hypothetical protein NL108_015144 [Boleophthalmus pectinirostris]|uniref:protein S100-B-like n=1 Tax=Boleophthalmus pectinirostris TaxID=150288 RepID=UPI00242B94FA|nr:protein S100-B-like [Boleophthalmus pectinirostris]KAJ0060543.1 hypothetical protein NL108_015144 [Boleophthalmus pectinirostris]
MTRFTLHTSSTSAQPKTLQTKGPVMAKLPQAMAMIRCVFDQYSQKKKTLSKQQVAELLRSEFGLEPGKNAQAEKLFETLDNDGSGAVDFTEFVSFVAALCVVESESE